MDAVKYIKEKQRMCNSFTLCKGCEVDYMLKAMPGSCINFFCENPEKAVSIVEKWADEHPAKTRQSEFLKMFPNAKRNGDYIDICPKIVDVKLVDQCKKYDHYDSCDGCKKDFWLAEVE